MAKIKNPKAKKRTVRPTIGWREWVCLPDLNISSIKAKIDTGARTSAIQANHVQLIEKNGKQFVRFQVHPKQREAKTSITVEAPVLEFRRVKSSSGQVTKRPVIMTRVEILGETFPIEITLAGRETMSFRLLLGREAVRRRFLIDPGRSYYGGKP